MVFDGVIWMECFEVKQEQENLWSVSCQGCTLSLYSSEDEARWAALMLASNSSESGTQAMVVITPPEVSQLPQGVRGARRFTGM
jgi:hypothetical protein